MATSGKLHTAQDNHAIKEAVISFIVSPQIIDPPSYQVLLNEGQSLHGIYHKFEPVKLKEVKIESSGLNNQTVESIKDAGFKFIAFKEGKTSKIIQGLPQLRQALLTFNTVDYQNWNTFKEESLSAAKKIANFQPIYKVHAFSLMYIDEFYFENGNEYNPNELFNLLESKNLPRGIEDSDFVDYNFNLRRHHEEKSYFENVSVKVFNEAQKKTIRIIGNLTFEIQAMPFAEVLESQDVTKYLDFSHNENKEMLKDILSPNIIKMIKL
ncbi:MAG: TIGR04255 family protein [Bacteroidales bacterium]|nr:TIGR04255 family protein [Bacteroidales bacterium]